MTDVHVITKDKNFIHLTPLISSQTSKGGIELPNPQNIKIEENPNLFAIYAILENKIKTLQVFVCYLMQKEKICSRKCIFDKIFGKFWLFKTFLAFWVQISGLLVARLNSERNIGPTY